MKLKYKVALGIIGILILVHVYMGVSYSLWVQKIEGTETNVIQTGCFKVEFEELSKSIHLLNTYPITDEKALTSIKPYQVKVNNTCETTDAGYALTINTIETTKEKLDDSKIKVAIGNGVVKPTEGVLLNSLEINPEVANIEVSGTLLTSYIGKTGIIERGQSEVFDVYLWVDERAGNEVMNQVFEAGVSITTYSVKMKNMEDEIKTNVVTSGEGVYEVSHEDAEITYTTDPTAIQNLKQTEYRYAGQNPNNYVSFNNELWRIVGLVNTPEGSRIKLIRSESIGSYSWDSSESNINEGYGINEWSTSKMMELLNNGAYYNRTNGTCYNDRLNATIDCDFSNTGLTEESKKMIDTITWNTGSNDEVNYVFDNINTTNFYNVERSNNTGKICQSSEFCNDTVDRTTTWVGKIGLINPSDYGYATSGGTTTNRETCLTTVLYNNDVSDCYGNNWLYQAGAHQWLLTPHAYETLSRGVFIIFNDGKIGNDGASSANTTHPSIYLKQNVKIISGNGTESSPYELIM